MIFRILMYMQYFHYITIALLVVAIVIWVIFAKKKLRWAKIMAIILTVLVVITGTLGATSIFFGENLLQRGFPQRDLPEEELPEGFERDSQRLRNRESLNQDNNNESFKLELDSYNSSFNPFL